MHRNISRQTNSEIFIFSTLSVPCATDSNALNDIFHFYFVCHSVCVFVLERERKRQVIIYSANRIRWKRKRESERERAKEREWKSAEAIKTALWKTGSCVPYTYWKIRREKQCQKIRFRLDELFFSCSRSLAHCCVLFFFLHIFICDRRFIVWLISFSADDISDIISGIRVDGVCFFLAVTQSIIFSVKLGDKHSLTHNVFRADQPFSLLIY